MLSFAAIVDEEKISGMIVCSLIGADNEEVVRIVRRVLLLLLLWLHLRSPFSGRE
jgi:hypothetical protein